MISFMTARAVTICKSALVPRSRGEWETSHLTPVAGPFLLAKMPLSFAIYTGSPPLPVAVKTDKPARRATFQMSRARLPNC
jgi:hypothetical protein